MPAQKSLHAGWLMMPDMMAKAAMLGILPLGLLACNSAALESNASETQAAALPEVAAAQVTTSPVEPKPPAVPGPADFIFDGQMIQGGWIRGQAPAGALSASLDGQELTLDDAGYFFAAFDRDARETATLTAQLRDGRIVRKGFSVAPRQWNIERVNLARPQGKASEAFMIRRRPELAKIGAARAINADSDGWRQNFIWPVEGRISGQFGSQRIYAGVPGSYHSGIDIATGASGTPYVAPANGVVVLATKQPFSLEGYLLIIDHGNGLNSAFLHNSKLVVSEGDVVRQGQHIGNIGSTGSATGPHLHWSIKWHGARLDPILFTGPMR